MPYNVNTESISQSLFELAHPLTHPDDKPDPLYPRVYVHLMQALKRPLTRQLANQILPNNLLLIETGRFHPQWVKDAMRRGQKVYDFNPSDTMRAQISHVIDWIYAAIANNEPWLQHCDDFGRPLKLLKIGSLQQAVREADKAMLRAAGASVATLAQNDFKTIKRFDDGAEIVQLLTEQALDAESRAMRHCVGNGRYDNRLRDGDHAYYSLRTPTGKVAATLEVRHSDNTLLQCKGRQNLPPVQKYIGYIQDFVIDRQFRLDECPSHTGLIEQFGKYYRLTELPATFCRSGNLIIRDYANLRLPSGLTVEGNLEIFDTSIAEFGTNITVTGRTILHRSGPQTIPLGFSTHDLYLNRSPTRHLSPDIDIGRDLIIIRSKLRELPHDLYIPEQLAVYQTKMKELPTGLNVGRLDICDTRISNVPPDIVVRGKLRYNRPLTIPPSAKVDEIAPKYEFLQNRTQLARAKALWATQNDPDLGDYPDNSSEDDHVPF